MPNYEMSDHDRELLMDIPHAIHCLLHRALMTQHFSTLSDGDKATWLATVTDVDLALIGALIGADFDGMNGTAYIIVTDGPSIVHSFIKALHDEAMNRGYDDPNEQTRLAKDVQRAYPEFFYEDNEPDPRLN